MPVSLIIGSIVTAVRKGTGTEASAEDRARLADGLARIEQRLDAVAGLAPALEARGESLDRRLDAVVARFDGLERRLVVAVGVLVVVNAAALGLALGLAL